VVSLNLFLFFDIVFDRQLLMGRRNFSDGGL
jgi:hypothetical protein